MLVQVSNKSTFLDLMQQDPLQIRDKLLAGLDRDYNVSRFFHFQCDFTYENNSTKNLLKFDHEAMFWYFKVAEGVLKRQKQLKCG